jgi:asparagine synthetase B (glutamine-hydrolysing)
MNDLKLLLLLAVKYRIMSIPEIKYNYQDKSVAVMFSGGLDSTILVALIAEVLA